MKLLLTQNSYFEGLDVLYATNTFCILKGAVTGLLLSQVDTTPQYCLIPQAHLNRITSLEVRWYYILFGSGLHLGKEREFLTRELRRLVRSFPSVRKLHFSFADGLYSRLMNSEEILPEMDKILFDLFGELLASTTYPIELIIDLPTGLSRPMFNRAREDLDSYRVLLDRSNSLTQAFWFPLRYNNDESDGAGKMKGPGGLWIAWIEGNALKYDEFRTESTPVVEHGLA